MSPEDPDIPLCTSCQASATLRYSPSSLYCVSFSSCLLPTLLSLIFMHNSAAHDYDSPHPRLHMLMGSLLVCLLHCPPVTLLRPGMQSESRWPSLSGLDRRICELFFFWDVFNVFLGAMFGGAIFSQLGASIKDPGDADMLKHPLLEPAMQYSAESTASTFQFFGSNADNTMRVLCMQVTWV